jgi:ribonuclease HI
MELRAVIEGLTALEEEGLRVNVVTDSEYVSRGMTEWLPNWLRNDWRRGPKRGSPPVKNVELWKRLVGLCDQHRVDFEHVAAHAGHPENEECDRLAFAAARRAAEGQV